MEIFSRISARAFLVLACFTALGLVSFGAEGLRGTDQYWYIADVERIVNGDELVTNTFFPGPILRNNALPEKNHIHHNSPMLYIVALFAGVLSTYHSWIVANILCHFIVAYVVFSLAKKFTGFSIAAFVTGFYLVSPIAIWQMINPLLEMYFSALLALVLFLYFNREKFHAGVALWLLIAVGVVSHPIFIVPSIVYGFYWAYENRQLKKALLLSGFFGYFIMLFFVLQQKTLWFPSSFQPNLSAIIASAPPGKSNMFWHYSEVLPKIDLQMISSKFAAALQRHSIELKFLPFYVFTNLAILGALYLAVFYLRRWWLIIVPLGFFGSQYLAMIFLQQNHPRFQQIIASVTFLMLAIFLYQSRKYLSRTRLDMFRLFVCFSWICFVLMNCYMIYSVRIESRVERDDIASLIQQTDRKFVGEGVRLVSIDVMPHNPFAYILRPSDVLFVRTDMLSEEKILRVIELFDPNFVISRKNGTLFNPESTEIHKSLNSARFGSLVVFTQDTKEIEDFEKK